MRKVTRVTLDSIIVLSGSIRAKGLADFPTEAAFRTILISVFY